MSNQTKLTFERLTDWIEGRLPTDEAAEVARLVEQADPTAQSDAEWLRAFQQVRQEIVLTSPPTRVRSALAGRFVEYAQRREQKQGGFFERLLGALTFDSAQQPTTSGIRSVGTAQTRQLIYSTELLDVAINLQPDPQSGQTNLLGQLLPNYDDAVLDDFSVQLVSSDREIDMTMSDELGEFSFDQLASGTYRLYVTADQNEIEIPPFDLE